MRAVEFFLNFFTIIFVVLVPWRVAAVNVTLGWNPSTSPDVIGYNIRYGLESGKYAFKLSTGTNTSGTVTGLIQGITYYFVVTGSNSEGVESGPSNEVGYTVPGMASPGNPWIQIDAASGLPVLKWNPSPSPNVAGYNVYYGSTSDSPPELVYSGSATAFSLTNSADTTNGYLVATAYDATGQESLVTSAVSTTNMVASNGSLAAPVLSWKQIPSSEFTNVFTVTASGAIPQTWALEASANSQMWGSLATGSNSAVDVTIIVSPHPKMFFRLTGSLPGMRMNLRQLPNAFPGSFILDGTGTPTPYWMLQSSDDMTTWNNVVSGTNSAVNVAVIRAKVPSLTFRLKSL